MFFGIKDVCFPWSIFLFFWLFCRMVISLCVIGNCRRKSQNFNNKKQRREEKNGDKRQHIENIIHIKRVREDFCRHSTGFLYYWCCFRSSAFFPTSGVLVVIRSRSISISLSLSLTLSHSLHTYAYNTCKRRINKNITAS